MPLRLFGVPVSEAELRRLVATLAADGKPDALSAADVITTGLDRGLAAVALTIEQRGAILDMLQDAETDGLAELRGALYRDFLQRNP